MDLEPVRRVFAERHASGAAPNLAWGVLAGGELVDGEDVDTAYRIASCTKSFTAAALLLLRDRGLVDLDAPITEWVPALRLTPTSIPVPTLRHLLTMSAGLANDDPWADRQEAMSDDEFDATCAGGVRLLWAPGTTFEYSNLGYALLGRVVQVAAGRRYQEFVTEELLRPLGLTSTAFSPPDCAVASGFDKQGRRVGRAAVQRTWRVLPDRRPVQHRHRSRPVDAVVDGRRRGRSAVASQSRQGDGPRGPVACGGGRRRGAVRLRSGRSPPPGARQVRVPLRRLSGVQRTHPLAPGDRPRDRCAGERHVCRRLRSGRRGAGRTARRSAGSSRGPRCSPRRTRSRR